MRIQILVDFFIHPTYFLEKDTLIRARLLVRASFLTSLFSNSYIWMSMLYDYDRGVTLMIFNGIGFLLLPFLVKTKLPINWLGNLYVAIGAFAIIVLTYYSGGMWSAVYPWMISIPVLALLVVNKLSGSVWGAISFLIMVWFGLLAIQGVELPVEYNPELKTLWFVSVLPGLLLIVLFIAFVFEYSQSKALADLEESNEKLEVQKTTITAQSSELEALIEEKDFLIRVLAHDLKSPLKNIESLATLLENDFENYTKYVSLIVQSTEKAQDLLSKVMEMDVSDPKDIKLNLGNIDLVELMQYVIDFMSESAKAKQIDISMVTEKAKAIISADKINLTSVFENLLSNALKFSKSGTQVQVVITTTSSIISVKIIDQGPGISASEEGHLFKKFSRLSSRPTAGESSTGLGLFLVKRHVELLEGKVYFTRNEGKGSTFTVELPFSI